MGNDAICLEKQGKCGAMADMFPVASVEGGDSLIDGLNDKVDVLESKVELLQGTFDVWQKLVESILGTAQTAMQYDNNVLTALGIAIAIVIGVVAYWSNKSRKDTIKKLDKKISEGILSETPEVRSKIINAIIESNEFKEQVKNILDKSNVFTLDRVYGEIRRDSETNITQVTPKNLEEDSNTNNEG